MKLYRKRNMHTSREIAKARAELTIASDRFDCDPELLCQMKKELLHILAKYIDSENDCLKIHLNIVCEGKWGISYDKTIQIK